MKPIDLKQRRVSSMLAGLYVIFVVAMAIGIYAAIAASAPKADDQQNVTRARLAADSGLSFLRYQLSLLSIPPNTKDSDLLGEVARGLKAQTQGSLDFHEYAIDLVDGTLYIPGGPGEFVHLDEESRFRATIRSTGGNLSINVTGRHQNEEAARSLQIDFVKRAYRTTLFNYAVASRGQIYMKKGEVMASPASAGVDMMSAFASDTSSSIQMAGGAVGGRLLVSGNKDRVALSGGTVGGAADPKLIRQDHIQLASAPDFPTVDTSPFKAFATHSWTGDAKGPFTNLRIAANSNPQFAGDNGTVVINGILYIESPNSVEFRGGATINGIIVFENKGNSAVNRIDCRGNVTIGGVPGDAPFADLKQRARGYSILAPSAAVAMSGSGVSRLEGSLLAGSFNFVGGSDLVIHNGSLITFNAGPSSIVFEGKTVTFTGSPRSNLPTTGMTFNQFFVPEAASYAEVPTE